MSGKPGRSGGHNRISIEEHLRRGTFRPVRHLAALAASSGPQGVPPDPPPELLTGLAEAGGALVVSAWRGCELTAFEAELLRMAAEYRDDAAEARRRGDKRAEHAASRLCLQALRVLGLPLP